MQPVGLGTHLHFPYYWELRCCPHVSYYFGPYERGSSSPEGEYEYDLKRGLLTYGSFSGSEWCSGISAEAKVERDGSYSSHSVCLNTGALVIRESSANTGGMSPLINVDRASDIRRGLEMARAEHSHVPPHRPLPPCRGKVPRRTHAILDPCSRFHIPSHQFFGVEN